MAYTLFEKMKPQLVTNLEKNKAKYNTVENLYKTLTTEYLYSNLKLSDLQLIVTFGEYEYSELGYMEIMYGDPFFYTSEELDKLKG